MGAPYEKQTAVYRYGNWIRGMRSDAFDSSVIAYVCSDTVRGANFWQRWRWMLP